MAGWLGWLGWLAGLAGLAGWPAGLLAGWLAELAGLGLLSSSKVPPPQDRLRSAPNGQYFTFDSLMNLTATILFFGLSLLSSSKVPPHRIGSEVLQFVTF